MDKLNILTAYDVSDAKWDDGWRAVRGDCECLSDWGKAILSTGLKGSVGGILLEPHYTCKDHRNLFSNFYSKKFTPSSPYTSRLHFFSEPVSDIVELLLSPKDYLDLYVGYSVIRPVSERCLGRTVIDPHKLKNVDASAFYCLRTKFDAHIAGRTFEVEGYPYVSQDGDVTVCAHSALWGVCRYLSERYAVYSETYPFDIIQLTESTYGRTFPYRGMTYSDYCRILSEFGCHPVVLRLKEDRDATDFDPEEYLNLYTYVESGFPVLASYQGHVATFVGHTIDYAKNVSVNADGFIDSSSYVKQFIVVDDNFFPYQLLGEQGDPDNYGAQYPDQQYDLHSVVVAVCPLPEKVFLPAEKARSMALEYFKAMTPQLEKTGSGPFVTRLYVTTNSAFKRRKLEKNAIVGNSGDFDTLSYFVSQLRLPHFIWVMEAGPVDLYKQGKCTAELVLDATSSVSEDASIYMRIGNTLILQGLQRTYDDDPESFYQYTHNLGEK